MSREKSLADTLEFFIKGVLCIIWFFTCTLITIPLSLLRWRHPSNSYFFAFIWTKVAVKILGIKIEILNKERLTRYQPCIYICNHQNNLDIIVQASAYRPNTVIIGKRELIYIPVFGLLFYLTGNVLLNRSHRKTALRSMDQVEEFIKNKKVSVFIFPEGTRNHGAPQLLPFKRGAFYLAVKTQVPLIPIVASPINKVVDLKEKHIKGGTVYLNVMEPISTTGMSEKDVDNLLQEAQIKMQKAFEQSFH